MSDIIAGPETPTINHMIQALAKVDEAMIELEGVDFEKLQAEFREKAEWISNELTKERIENFGQLYSQLQDWLYYRNPSDKSEYMETIEDMAWSVIGDFGHEVIDLS